MTVSEASEKCLGGAFVVNTQCDKACQCETCDGPVHAIEKAAVSRNETAGILHPPEAFQARFGQIADERGKSEEETQGAEPEGMRAGQ